MLPRTTPLCSGTGYSCSTVCESPASKKKKKVLFRNIKRGAWHSEMCLNEGDSSRKHCKSKGKRVHTSLDRLLSSSRSGSASGRMRRASPVLGWQLQLPLPEALPEPCAGSEQRSELSSSQSFSPCSGPRLWLSQFSLRAGEMGRGGRLRALQGSSSPQPASLCAQGAPELAAGASFPSLPPSQSPSLPAS